MLIQSTIRYSSPPPTLPSPSRKFTKPLSHLHSSSRVHSGHMRNGRAHQPNQEPFIPGTQFRRLKRRVNTWWESSADNSWIMQASCQIWQPHMYTGPSKRIGQQSTRAWPQFLSDPARFSALLVLRVVCTYIYMRYLINTPNFLTASLIIYAHPSELQYNHSGPTIRM